MKVFIIIVHFGENSTTANCIKSILAKEKDFEKIIVVDNSSDFKKEEMSEKVVLLKNKTNLGFAKAVNIGINYAMARKADYILLLNNDTVIKMPIIKNLTEFLSETKEAGIVAPAISFTKNEQILFDVGGRVNKLFGRTSHNEVLQLENKNPLKTDYVSGCCMLIKKEVIEKIGLLDERFFLYYEDVDYCLRAKKLGLLTYVLPSVSIYHCLSQTIGKNSSLAVYHQTKSALQFGKKYFKGIKRVSNIIFITFQSLYLFSRSPGLGRAVFSALLDNL